MNYRAAQNRYDSMMYRRCGKSGLKLPAISLGLWHNFGGVDIFQNCRDIIHTAFDNGITHFDLANNYGPPAGSAEETFGKMLAVDLKSYRDELIISTKAGYDMWDGPYGDWGSKKYLVSSLDQSLRRMGLDYVDIFYHHRFDPETPLEETMGALDLLCRQGKALYVGISNYDSEQTRKAVSILNDLGTPCLIHQPKYSMLDRTVEMDGIFSTVGELGVGSIVFSPLAQGLLTDKYLYGIPENSRAAKSHGFLNKDDISENILSIIQDLNAIAQQRNQTLAEMAIAWLLTKPEITSVLVGASSSKQLLANINSLNNTSFSSDELKAIDSILARNK